MMPPGPGGPRKRRFWRYVLIAAGGGWLLLGFLFWYTSTDSFQAMVRRRLVTELERVTGGRVEVGSFHTTPFRFEVDVRDLTIHGREGAGEVPYAHVDRLVAEVKLISILGAEFGFQSVIFERPVVHIILYPDGTTNQPTPRVSSGESPVAKLFSFSINHLEVRTGKVLWNDQEIPLEFEATDVTGDMTYFLLRRRYEGSLRLGKVDTRAKDYRPVAWMAEARFGLGQNRLEIHSLKASAGRSQLEVSGRVEDFRDPRVSVTYKLTADVGEAAAIIRQPEVRRGLWETEGKGEWSLREFSSTGKMTIRDLDWRDANGALRGVAGSTDYAITSQRFMLTQIQAKVLGGTVSGDADITDWMRPAVTAKGSRKQKAEQKGSVNLRLKEISAQEVALALSSAARPLQRMRIAGAITGTVETRWRGSTHNADSQVALDVTAPSKLEPGQLPLNGHTHATYHAASGALDVSDLYAATRATEARASGTLSNRASLRCSVSTTSLSEWQPTLAALGYQDRIPVTLRGRASFNGLATGKLSDIAFSGRLQSQDFDWMIPSRSSAPAKELRWDFLDAEVQLSPHMLAARNGVLHHGKTTVDFNFNLNLQERKYSESSAFNAAMDLHEADISEVLAVAGYDLPVTGTGNLFVQASGTLGLPHGGGRVEIADATIRGEAVQRFQSRFSFSGRKLTLEDMRLAHNDAQVTGDGTYNFETRAFRFNVNGTNFDLASMKRLQIPPLSVGGRLDFALQGWGTPEQPTFNANLGARGLTLNGELVGDYKLDAVTSGAELGVTGRSQFKETQFDIDGDVLLRGDWASNIKLQFRGVDLDAILRAYARDRFSGHAVATGTLELRGPLRIPGSLAVTGNVSDFRAEVQQVKVQNRGPIHFTIANQVLDIQQLRLAGTDTDLTVSGSAQLNNSHELNLKAAGRAGLTLIQSFNPDFTTSGVVALDVAVTGILARPAIQGRLQILDGNISYRDLPSALSEMNGSLLFNQDRLEIENLTAHVGGGLVTFGGYATAYNRQLNFDLTLRTQDLRLRYPPGVSSTTNADLHFAGSPSAATLSGSILVNKLAVTPGFDFGAYLERSAQASALPQTNPLLNRIRLDVHIVTAPELQMQTAVVRLSGDADLHLQGTAAKPVLLGRADVIEGEVYFNGTKYRMERGDVLFTNPVTTTPVLDLQASTRVREYDITVNLNGEFDKLNMKYLSDPPLPTADIISLLALGQTQQESAQLQQSGQSSFAQQASSAALAEALNSALSNRSRSLFGISHIKIDPQGLNTVTSPTTTSPAVTIEQQVKENLTLTYTTSVAQTSQQIIQAEYTVSRNVSIVAIRDYNGVVSFEVRIRQRKK